MDTIFKFLHSIMFTLTLQISKLTKAVVLKAVVINVNLCLNLCFNVLLKNMDNHQITKINIKKVIDFVLLIDISRLSPINLKIY